MELEPRTSTPAHATGAVEFVELSAIDDDATFRLREEGDVSALASSLGRLGQLVPVELRPLPGADGSPPRYQVVAGFRRVAALRLLRRGRALARVHAAFTDEDAWGLALSLALLTDPLDRTALDALRERLQASGAAPWADELVDEALVRAPVDPELRERFFDFLSTPPGPAAAAPLGELGPGDGGDEERDLAALDGAGAAEAITPAAGDQDAQGEPEAPAEAEAEASGEAEGPGEEPSAEAPGGGVVEVTPEELAADVATRLYDVNQDLAVAYEAWADLPPEGRRAILEQARWIADLLARLEPGDEEGR